MKDFYPRFIPVQVKQGLSKGMVVPHAEDCGFIKGRTRYMVLDATYIDWHLVALKGFEDARKEQLETWSRQNNLETMVKLL